MSQIYLKTKLTLIIGENHLVSESVEKRNTIISKYNSLHTSGEIDFDEAQIEVIASLDQILAKLVDKEKTTSRGIFSRIFGNRENKRITLKGLYIWGAVGRGKTILMDMFYELCPIERKKRIHFHEFMTDVHARVHRYRQALKRGEVSEEDPIPPVAKELAADIEVLCFDEFSVTDIADAMILGRLFTQLFSLQVLVIATSNVEPSNLYTDGLNRSLFVPFIKLLETYVDIICLDSPTDYRLEKLGTNPVYLTPLNQETRKQMNSLWYRLTGTLEGNQEWIEIKGRKIEVPCAIFGAARFTFDDLCGNPNGAAEYLELARKYHTFFIDEVPDLDISKRNEAKRFITLIDTLYNNRTRVILSAQSKPENIYQANSGNEVFEFQRTISRLREMQSSEYLTQVDI